jgi:hypothetical protein
VLLRFMSQLQLNSSIVFNDWNIHDDCHLSCIRNQNPTRPVGALNGDGAGWGEEGSERTRNSELEIKNLLGRFDRT